MLRWLLPVFAVLALLGSSVTAWAAAGFVGESACCCPDPSKCKCHEHDGDPQPAPTLKRCGGEAQWVAPAVVAAVAAAEPALAIDVQIARVVTVALQPVPEPITIEPETPPF